MINEYGQKLELQKVMKIKDNGRSAKIYFCAELEEYCVKFFHCGVYLTEADYFTDDLDDAYRTAREELIRSGNSWGLPL